MDREELIEAFIEADQDTDLGMWRSCRIAWELFDKYGQYSQDTVQVLRKECNMGYDAVYNRRNAWEEICRLVKSSWEAEIDENGEIVEFRFIPLSFPGLKASHFYRLHRLRNRPLDPIKITDDQARKYLQSAIEFHWSGNDLVEAVEKNHDPDEEKTFIRKIAQNVRIWKNLFSDSDRLGRLGLPVDLMNQLYLTLKAIDEWLLLKGERNETN